MTAEPVLGVDEPRSPVRAVALVLHGGRARSTAAVRPTQLAVLRMRPFATALHRAGRDAGLAVATLRYAARGWNGEARSPVQDVRWALERLAQRFPGAPTALVGHSMGGRAAVYAAGQESVRAVVGLAPWIEAGDPDGQLADRHLLVVHGNHDRMTSARNSAAFVRQAARVAASTAYVTVQDEGHAMLRRAALWHEIATGWVLARMCGVAPADSVRPATAALLDRALAGELALVV